MILTVDDVGFHGPANRLVERAVQLNVPSHLGVMVTMPGSAEALDLITERPFRQLAIGLHFNISESVPASDPASIPSLIDPATGEFYPWPAVFKRSALGQIRADELTRETEAQLERLTDRVPIDFFNSHHHVHLWPPIARLLAPIIQRARLRQIRHPRQIWWRAGWERYGIKGLLLASLSQRQRPATNRLTNDFVDFDWIDPTDEARANALTAIPPTAELACHPHLYTRPSDATRTPHPVSSLEWLTTHHALLSRR